MGVYAKPLDLQKAQLARFLKVQKGSFAMHREIAEAGLADARELTSGLLPPKVTKGAFARGRSPGNPGSGFKRGAIKSLPINKQSGRLHGSMGMRQVSRRHLYSQVIDVGTIHGAGRSGYVLLPAGTREMAGRRFFTQTKKRWRARNNAFVQYHRKLNRTP